MGKGDGVETGGVGGGGWFSRPDKLAVLIPLRSKDAH